ncbi:MAG: EAL domain-containing protein [Halothiobacillus sp.]
MAEKRLAKILSNHATALAVSLDATVESFYHGLDQDPASHHILSILSVEERQQLHQSQVAHLRLLIDPTDDSARRQAMAERAGDIHAIIGVPASSLVNAFGLYLHKISQAILSLPCPLVERSTLLHIVSQRIQADLQWQMKRMDSHQASVDRVEQTLMTLCQSYRPWADIIRGILDIFLEIPGISGSGFVRQGASQEFVAEFVNGDYERYWAAIQKHDLDTRLSGMARCFIQAAHNQQPVRVANFTQHKYQALRHAAAEAGVRSAISVPIAEHTEHSLPILCLTSPYPNTFNAAPLSRVIQGISVQLNAAYRRAADVQDAAIGISFTERRFYRSLLTRGGLVMFYQPIVDLVSGAVIKVEALARLQLPEGKILSPAQFLPWFGQNELAELFSRGLTQALDQLVVWDRAGLTLRMNLNLPPEILVHPECPNWVARALRQSAIAPHRLHLELLETKAPPNRNQRDRAIARLAEIGVQLDMDDLGSGYSSLQRLHLMPFAGIKVDQDIMQGCLEGSSKALGIANAITSLGRDLGLSVVIEGLENPGLIEVAAILGAHKGQGYEIARPMPAADLAPWVTRWVWTINPQSPRTALGAWAKFWQWQRQAPWIRANNLDFPACGIGHFVREQGLQGSELDLAYQAMHSAMESADHDAAQMQVSQIERHLVALIT